jgi:butyrate kinase
MSIVRYCLDSFSKIRQIIQFEDKMQKEYRIFTINPGSTSTKVSYFINEKEVITQSIEVPPEVISHKTIWDQYEARHKSIIEFLQTKIPDIKEFDGIAGRGGLLRPISGGTYLINEKMMTDASSNFQGEHVANLGCVLAYDLAKKYNCKAYVVDPVSVDEFENLAYYSGHPEIKRKTLSHALNLHTVARLAAEKINKKLVSTSFVIAHLGGGITISPVKGGKIIDVNDASSDGPFSPERTGSLPLQQFATICYSGRFNFNEIKRLIMGKGGLVAYLGTNSAKEVEERISKGDEYAKEVYEAMAYQISKEIGAMSTVLKGKCDAIVLTGGLAKSKMITDWIADRVSFLAPIIIIPGENEMSALAQGVLRILTGEEEAKEY